MARVGQFLAHHVHDYYRHFDGVEVDAHGVGRRRVDAQSRPGLASGRREEPLSCDDPLLDQAADDDRDGLGGEAGLLGESRPG